MDQAASMYISQISNVSKMGKLVDILSIVTRNYIIYYFEKRNSTMHFFKNNLYFATYWSC
jgi:hypothetical protein